MARVQHNRAVTITLKRGETAKAKSEELGIPNSAFEYTGISIAPESAVNTAFAEAVREAVETVVEEHGLVEKLTAAGVENVAEAVEANIQSIVEAGIMPISAQSEAKRRALVAEDARFDDVFNPVKKQTVKEDTEALEL